MSNKFTPWFPGHIKPVRKGVYEADFYIPAKGLRIWSAYFDGEQWGWLTWHKNHAVSTYKTSKHNRHHSLVWRGLSKNPSFTPKETS